MRRRINNFISVIYTFFRLIIFKLCMGKKLKFQVIERISPNVSLDFSRNAEVILGNRIRIHSGCKIKVRDGACLEIQDGAKMNHNCIVACRHKIVIGEGSEFGPSVFLYDHDHKHNYLTGQNDDYNVAPIIIGQHCWIGANTIILKGAVLEDHCVIAAGSVVTGRVPRGSVFVQKRMPSIIYPQNKED